MLRMNSQNHALFQISPRESVQDGIQRLAEALADFSPTIPVRDPANLPKAVHETRLALKRARAVVRLLRPTLGSPVTLRLNRNLRTASQRLAEARDAEAGLQVLDQLSRKRSTADATTLQTTRSKFAKSIEDKELSVSQLTQGITRARTTLRSTAKTLKKASWKKRGWAVLSAGIKASHQRTRRRFKSARKSTDPAVLHAWRTASKSLLYQLAILRPISKQRLEQWMKHLDDLQKSLGVINDIATLNLHLGKHPDQFGGQAAIQPTLDILRREQDRRRKDVLKQGRRLLAEGTPEFLDQLAHEWKAWRKKKSGSRTKAP